MKVVHKVVNHIEETAFYYTRKHGRSATKIRISSNLWYLVQIEMAPYTTVANREGKDSINGFEVTIDYDTEYEFELGD